MTVKVLFMMLYLIIGWLKWKSHAGLELSRPSRWRQH